MKIIRKQLSASEIVSSALRIDPATGLVQRTYDGGSTWVNSPTDDPRSNPTFRLPALTATDAKCQAAEGLAAFTKSSMDYEISQLALGAGVVALVNGLVGLIYAAFPEVAWFSLVFDFAGGLLAAGSVALNTAFTSSVYADLACIFYQHMDATGQISPSGMTAILTAIDTRFGSTSLVNITMQGWFANLGSVGASNLGVAHALPGSDCTICLCPGGGFNALNGNGESGFAAGYTAGSSETIYDSVGDRFVGSRFTGGNSGHYQAACHVTFPNPPGVITIVYTRDAGISGAGNQKIYWGVAGTLQPPGNALGSGSHLTTIFDLTGQPAGNYEFVFDASSGTLSQPNGLTLAIEAIGVCYA